MDFIDTPGKRISRRRLPALLRLLWRGTSEGIKSCTFTGTTSASKILPICIPRCTGGASWFPRISSPHAAGASHAGEMKQKNMFLAASKDNPRERDWLWNLVGRTGLFGYTPGHPPNPLETVHHRCPAALRLPLPVNDNCDMTALWTGCQVFFEGKAAPSALLKSVMSNLSGQLSTSDYEYDPDCRPLLCLQFPVTAGIPALTPGLGAGDNLKGTGLPEIQHCHQFLGMVVRRFPPWMRCRRFYGPAPEAELFVPLGAERNPYARFSIHSTQYRQYGDGTMDYG